MKKKGGRVCELPVLEGWRTWRGQELRVGGRGEQGQGGQGFRVGGKGSGRGQAPPLLYTDSQSVLFMRKSVRLSGLCDGLYKVMISCGMIEG